MKSKDIIKLIDADMAQFKALGDKWVEADDVAAAAKSRSYAKRLMKNLKMYVRESMKDAENVKPVEVVEFVEVIEEEVVEAPKSDDSWFIKED